MEYPYESLTAPFTSTREPVEQRPRSERYGNRRAAAAVRQFEYEQQRQIIRALAACLEHMIWTHDDDAGPDEAKAEVQRIIEDARAAVAAQHRHRERWAKGQAA